MNNFTAKSIVAAFSACYFLGVKISTDIKLTIFSFQMPQNSDLKKLSCTVCALCFVYFIVVYYHDYSIRPRPQNRQEKPYVENGWANDDTSRVEASAVIERNIGSLLKFIILDIPFVFLSIFVPVHFILSKIF